MVGWIQRALERYVKACPYGCDNSKITSMVHVFPVPVCPKANIVPVKLVNVWPMDVNKTGLTVVPFHDAVDDGAGCVFIYLLLSIAVCYCENNIVADRPAGAYLEPNTISYVQTRPRSDGSGASSGLWTTI